MSNNIFPEITFQDGRWFLRYISGGELVKEVDLPNNPMLNRIWEASHNLLDVYIDDCGANLDRCVQFCNEASKLFAGVSQLAADLAADYKKQIELNELYKEDENEKWYQK